MHPAAGLPLERVVPASGVEISGHFIRGGTIVGCSPWVIHRRTDIFGPDADVYNPDRWLTASPDQLKVMDGMMLQFGAGSRTCIGKNISLMEIYKIIPSFLRRFEVCTPFLMRQIQVMLTSFGRYNWHILTKNGNCGMHGLYANSTSRRSLLQERL